MYKDAVRTTKRANKEEFKSIRNEYKASKKEFKTQVTDTTQLSS